MSTSANYPTLSPSLLLDFANTQALDPRVTFTRSTTGTYYNGVTSAVAEQNLVIRSQGTGMATSWGADSGAQSTRVDNSVAAPDGTTTAMSFTSLGGYANMSQNVSTIAGSTYTLSFYAQVPSGTYTFSGGSAGITGTITTAWQRFTVTGTISTSSTVYLFNSVPITQVIYVWGAQLEQRSAVTAYTSTTTTAITNYIPVLQTASANVPRFDYDPVTGVSLGLLIEQQSTNLVLQSQFVSGWTLQGTDTLTLSADIAPDGTQTFAKFVPSTANVYPGHRILQNVTINNTTVYTFSAYIKNAGVRYVQLCLNTGFGIYANFDLTAGVVGTLTATSSSITAVGNGVYRCTITGTSTGTQGECNIIASTSASAGNFPVYAGDAFSGLYIWGAQLEATAFPTSYIPTTTAAVTRTADIAKMTGTNFSSWYNIAQGTYFASGSSNTVRVSTIRMGTINGGGGTNARLFDISSDGGASFNAYSNANSSYFYFYIFGTTTPYKLALNYNISSNSQNGTAQGASVNTATITGMSNIVASQLEIGSINNIASGVNWISKVAYYPQVLSNANLIALTGS